MWHVTIQILAQPTHNMSMITYADELNNIVGFLYL